MAVVAGKVPPLELQCVLLGVDAVTPGKDFSVRVRAWTSAGPVRVRSIELTWHGVERLDPVWVRPSPGGPPNKTNTRLAPGERYVARSQTISVANNVDVAPGDVKEFPVRVCLPPGLPPSFRGTVARIGYFITCTAVTKTSTDIRDGDSQDPKKITWERTSIGVPFKVRVFSGNGEPRNGSGTNQTPSTNARETSHDLDGAIVPQAFWMHALCAGATTCSGTTSIDGRIVRDINTKDDATSAHSRGESNATTQPTSNRLGVKPSHPARDSGSPGSPLVKCETTTKYDDPESLPSQNVATGFVIAVTDDWSGDGDAEGAEPKKITLAALQFAAPFPRSRPGVAISGRLEFTFLGKNGTHGDTRSDTKTRVDTRGTSSVSSETLEVSPESHYAATYANSPRIVRFSVSLETAEAVAKTNEDGKTDGQKTQNLKDRLFTPNAHSDQHDLLIRRKVWAETSCVVADVESVSFSLAAPPDAHPSFETASVSVQWALRFEFLWASPSGCAGSLGLSSSLDRSQGKSTNQIKPRKVQWTVPICMASAPAATKNDVADVSSSPGKANASGASEVSLGNLNVLNHKDVGKGMTRDSSLVGLS